MQNAEQSFRVLQMLLGFEPFDMTLYTTVLRDQLGYTDAKIKAASYEKTVRALAEQLSDAGYRLTLSQKVGRGGQV